MRVALFATKAADAAWSRRHVASLRAELEHAGVRVTCVSEARSTWTKPVDLVHVLDECDAASTLFVRAPRVVGCHGFGFGALVPTKSRRPADHSSATFKARAARLSLAHAAALVTDTDAGMAELEARLGARPPQIRMRIYPALHFPDAPGAATELPAEVARLRGPFALVVGSRDVHVDAALRTLLLAKQPLALVFVSVPASFANQASPRFEPTRDAVFIDSADATLLHALYREAHCLLLLEPFSTTHTAVLLEAQAAGCPVVSTASPALDELARGSALTTEPADFDALALHLDSLFDRSVRAQRRALGTANAELFRNVECGREYLALYEEVLTVRPREH